MAWDPTRPVPWKRLLRMFAIYAVVAFVVLTVLNPDDWPSALTGLALGGVIFLGLSAVLVKFGWEPATFKRPAKSPTAPTSQQRRTTASSGTRAKPAPTKRTNATNPRARRR